MVSAIIGIHGSSSAITFDCEDTRIKADGEFFAQDGKIAGFVVSKASLRFENGERLTPDEQEELIFQYEKYMSQNLTQSKWYLKFE